MNIFKKAQVRIVDFDFYDLKQSEEWTNSDWIKKGDVLDLRRFTSQLNYFTESFNCEIEADPDGLVSFIIFEKDNVGIGYVDFEIILYPTNELLDNLKTSYFSDEVKFQALSYRD